MDTGHAAQQAATEDDQAMVVSQLRSGGQWFYWIAALSIVNSGASALGSDWGFVIGLGITQVVDAIATVLAGELGGAVRAAAFVVDLIIAGGFALIGLLAARGRGWAFVVGMLLYVADGLLFLLAGDWLSLGFHGLALVFIFRGYQACRRLAREPAAIPVASDQDSRFAAPASS